MINTEESQCFKTPPVRPDCSHYPTKYKTKQIENKLKTDNLQNSTCLVLKQHGILCMMRIVPIATHTLVLNW